MKENPPPAAARPLDWAMLFLGIFSMSISAIFLKLAETSPLTVGFYRMAFAVAGALPFLSLEIKRRSKDPGEPPFLSKKRWPALRYALIGGILWGINLSLWNTAVLHSNATTSTLLNNLAPLWTGLILLFFYKERPEPRFWLGLAVALAGAAVMFWPELRRFHLHWTTWLVLCGSLCYANYVILQKKGRAAGLSAIELLFWVSLVGGLVILAECLWTGAPLAGFSTKTWLSMAGAGLVSSLLGWGLIGHAMGRLPVTLVSLALLNQAVFTAMMDFATFGVRLNFYQVAGGAIVICGLALVVAKRR